MRRLMVFVLVIILAVPIAHASEREKGGDALRRMLEERYRPSGIEMRDVTRLGQVTRTGKLLILDPVTLQPRREIEGHFHQQRRQN